MKKYILSLFLGITITGNAQICLDVPLIKQEQTQWCWAAASKCVLDFYGFVHRQCEIAEYVRLNGIFNNFGLVDCCVDALQGCNQGTSTTGGTGSIEDILVEFGNIANAPTGSLPIFGIEFHLNLQRPLIIRWENLSDPTHGHAMVVHGTNGYEIDYMDPDPEEGYQSLSYDEFLNNGVFQWALTIYPLVSPFIIPKHCSDCKKNGDEDEIDCGGSCPPCEKAPDYKNITTATSNLPSVVRAIKKITAGNATVKVLPGQNVSFHTLGTIELLPGFEVEVGGNFNTQIKDHIHEVTAACNKWCVPKLYQNRTWLRWNNHFIIDDVANTDKIFYEVWMQSHPYDGKRFVYQDTKYVTHNGRVELWDFVSGETKPFLKDGHTWYYYIAMWFYPCQSNIPTSPYYLYFFVYNSDHWKNQLSNTYSEPEEVDDPALFLSHNIENIVFPYENAISNFSIIPNPNPGTFQLETNFPLSDIANIKVTNLLGIPIYETQNLSSNTIQLPTSAAGTFFVVVMLKDGSVLTQKMMIQR